MNRRGRITENQEKAHGRRHVSEEDLSLNCIVKIDQGSGGGEGEGERNTGRGDKLGVWD